MSRLDPKEAAKEMRAAGLTPLEPYPGSNTPWECRCKRCKSIVTPRYTTVVRGGRGGCNVCAKKDAAETRKRAAEAEIMALLPSRQLEALEPYRDAHHRWLVRCLTCGREFRSAAQSIKNGSRCSACSHAARAERQRQQGAAAAEKVLRRAGLIPLTEYPGLHRPWPSICSSCGGETAPRLAGLRAGQGGCLNCGRRRRGESRRTPDAEARKLMEAAGFRPDPDIPYPGTGKPWPGLCLTCGSRRSPTFGNVKQGRKACKRCAMVESGVSFDIWSPARVYLIEHEQLGALKIGITSERNRSTRLTAHRVEGWKVVSTWALETGQQAVFVEGEILRWWRDELGEPAILSRKEMPQAGWTETIRAGAVTVASVQARVKRARKQARNLPPLPEAPEFVRPRCIAVKDGEQCEKDAYSRNYCQSHYMRWKKYGDPWAGKWPRTATACVVEVDGVPCGKPIRSNDKCSVHYERWYTYSDPLFMKRPTPGTRSKTCVVIVNGSPCGQEVIAREMCHVHYGHWRRHGDPLAGKFENPGQKCSVVEYGSQCERDATSRGMCGRHYNRWRQHGDPLVTLKRKAGSPPDSCPVSADGDPCGKPVVARGMCKPHYRRFMASRASG